MFGRFSMYYFGGCVCVCVCGGGGGGGGGVTRKGIFRYLIFIMVIRTLEKTALILGTVYSCKRRVSSRYLHFIGNVI